MELIGAELIGAEIEEGGSVMYCGGERGKCVARNTPSPFHNTCHGFQPLCEHELGLWMIALTFTFVTMPTCPLHKQLSATLCT